MALQQRDETRGADRGHYQEDDRTDRERADFAADLWRFGTQQREQQQHDDEAEADARRRAQQDASDKR